MTTSSEAFDAPAVHIPRDRFGRPLVTPPDGGKPVPYTRCTTYVDVLDDKFNLTQWEKRQVAVGLAEREDLLLAVSAHRDDKKRLNEIANEAKEAAKSSAAATTGTALHALTERVDQGLALPSLPERARRDLAAYEAATSELEPVVMEQFCVLDDLKIGGTPDRIVRYQGKYYIADVKTGGIDFGAMKIAMQLAVYSRATPYDYSTGERSPHPFDVDTGKAIVIHLPAGTGTCELRWIDINVGWQAVQIATEVRAKRAFKDWYETFAPAVTIDETAEWRDEIAKAMSVESLREVWAAAEAAGAYDNNLHQLCVNRKAELEGAA